MIECLATTNYVLRADIYRPLITQDITGVANKRWRYERTVLCSARSILRKGTGDNSTAMEIEERLNKLNSMVKLRCNRIIPSNRLVLNIRNEDLTIYQENQDPASAGGYNTATIFEVFGSSPIVNYDGAVIEYETILKRREIQQIVIG